MHPRISVIIPTYQRRDLVLEAVRALSRQDFSHEYEIIVVVDGSSDGTAEALSSLDLPVRLKVLRQQNSGLARTRNNGARAATGEILLFLDDDMEASATLLAEHERAYREEVDAVLGSIPLHPQSPDNLISRGIALWADQLAQRLADAGSRIAFNDIIGGNFSIRRATFEHLGGFDETFNRGGSYGAEDVEFGYRLLNAGYQVAFNPAAVAWQRYVTSPAAHLRQCRQVGRADVAITRKHPELCERTFAGKRAASRLYRVAESPVLWAPRLAQLFAHILRRPVASRVERGSTDQFTTRLFFLLRALEYWSGVHEAGGIPAMRPVRVLNYHAVADLAGDPVMEPYGITPEQFRDQMEELLRAGYQFLHPSEFIRFVEGGAGVPRKALLLTFDDCYTDLLTAALPVLERSGICAVGFAVAGHLGGTNEWDRPRGSGQLSLLGVAQLLELSQSGHVEIGAHSRTHRPLSTVPAAELGDEIAGSGMDLARAGLPSVRFFAYPHGDHDDRVRSAARSAGYLAAFTVDAGRVHSGDDAYAIRRVEILRGDIGWRFRLKVLLAGHRLAVGARIRYRLRRFRSSQVARQELQPLCDGGESSSEVVRQAERQVSV